MFRRTNKPQPKTTCQSNPALQALKQKAIEAARRDPTAWAAYAWKAKVYTTDRTGIVAETAEQMILPPHARDMITFCRSHPRAVILIPPGHCKSVSISQVLVSWALGLKPDSCWAIVSKTQKIAARNTRAITSNIAGNPRTQEVFPGLVPSEECWSPIAAILAGRAPGNPDVSLQAVGVGGALAGTRLDGLVVDDPQDALNSRTEQSNDNLLEWLDSVALPRLAPGAPCWLVCTSWSTDDLAHRLIARGWPSMVLPAIQDENTPQERPLWAARWPLAALQAKRDGMDPSQWARVWQQNPMCDADSRFKSDWVTGALLEGAKAGGLCMRLDSCPSGSVILCGVDPAVKRTKTSDLAALVVVEVRSNRTRRVLDVLAGKMDGPTIFKHLQDVYDRYARPICYVEDNAAQDYLRQFAPREWDIRPHHTGATTPIEFEIEKLAGEFSRGLWLLPGLPSGTPAHGNIQGLINGMYKWRRGQHADDRLAALCFVAAHADDSFAHIHVAQNPIWHV